MSDVSQGPGWWLASDDKWYAPELRPSAAAAVDGSPVTGYVQTDRAPGTEDETRAEVPTVPRSHPGATIIGPSQTSDPSVSSRHPKRRLVAALAVVGAAVILASVLVFTLGSGSGTNGLAGRSAAQVLAMTTAASKRQGSVHMTESDKPTGSGTYDVGSTRGMQTITDGSEGNASLLVLPGIAYLKGDAEFLETQVGLSVSNASLYAQRWISFVPNDSAYDYQQLVAGDTLGSALSESTPSGRLTLTSQRSVDGQSVVGLSGGLGALTPSGAKGTEILYVSTVAPYLPVEFVLSGTYEGQAVNTTLTFSDWGEPISVTAPSGATPESSISTSTS